MRQRARWHSGSTPCRGGFKNTTNHWCTGWVGGGNVPVCGVFKETGQRMMGRCRMSWTCVREEEERNGSRKKGRERRRDPKRSDTSHSPHFFLFSVSRPVRIKVPHVKQTTHIIKAALFIKGKTQRDEAFESRRAGFSLTSHRSTRLPSP